MLPVLPVCFFFEPPARSKVARLLGRHVPDESNASLRMVADQAAAEQTSQTRQAYHFLCGPGGIILLIVMVWVLT